MRAVASATLSLALLLSACDTGEVLEAPPPPVDELRALMARGENPPPDLMELFDPYDLFDPNRAMESPGLPVADGPVEGGLALVGLEPATFRATLGPGESVVEHKVLDIPATPPRGDVLFAHDLTASMGGELANAQANSAAILAAVSAAIGDVRFGLVTYTDYPGRVSLAPCGLDRDGFYGRVDAGDYPYRLDVPLTGTSSDVLDALGSLALLNGGDLAESYARVLYEATADPAIGWRPGARRILVNWADAFPHDCDVLAPIGIDGVITGIDPGRDGVAGTPDDLPMDFVLNEVKEAGVTLVNLFSGTRTGNRLWTAYAEELGGGSLNYRIRADGSFPPGVEPAAKISELIEEAVSRIARLALVPCPGSEELTAWIADVTPAEVTELELPTSLEFDVTYRAPADAAPGTYTFELCAVGDAAEYGRQTVTLQFGSNQPPVADAGADRTGEAALECMPVQEEGGTAVLLDGSASSDPDGDLLDYTWYDAEGTVVGTGAQVTVYPSLGVHDYLLVVSDGDLTDSDGVTVSVEDTTAPDVTLDVGNGELWPPNHKYVEIDLSALAADACDPALAVTGQVVSDEPDDVDGNGDGTTTGDIKVVAADGTVRLSSDDAPAVPFDATSERLFLRAERAGRLDGRVYTISLTATDAGGNATTRAATVVVPHNR